jgi:hypothetical protein
VEWYQWAFDGVAGTVGVAFISGVVTWWYRRRRRRDTPEQTRSLIKGNVGDNSRIRRVRMRNAHHLVDGDVGRSRIEDVDFQ